MFSTSLQSIFIILLLKGPFHVLKSFYTGSQPDPKRSFQQPSLAGSPSPLAFSFLLIVFHCLLGLCSCFSLPHYLINIQIPLSCLLSLMKHHNILVFGFLPELKLKYEQWAGFFSLLQGHPSKDHRTQQVSHHLSRSATLNSFLSFESHRQTFQAIVIINTPEENRSHVWHGQEAVLLEYSRIAIFRHLLWSPLCFMDL